LLETFDFVSLKDSNNEEPHLNKVATDETIEKTSSFLGFDNLFKKSSKSNKLSLSFF